jgi:hypothetical protein
MNDYNATRAELLEALAAQATRLTRVENERDMWRNENAKKTAACEQMGARIGTLEAERDRLTDALKKIGGITMSMCLNYKDMAETQRDIARTALKESGQ